MDDRKSNLSAKRPRQELGDGVVDAKTAGKHGIDRFANGHLHGVLACRLHQDRGGEGAFGEWAFAGASLFVSPERQAEGKAWLSNGSGSLCN